MLRKILRSKRLRIFALVAFLFAIASCAWPYAKLRVPELLPEEREILTLTVRKVNVWEAEIKVPKMIEPFLAFVRDRSDGWSKVWDTFPTPMYTISIYSGKGLRFHLWVGENWIGSDGYF